jgi:hypothetical protein
MRFEGDGISATRQRPYIHCPAGAALTVEAARALSMLRHQRDERDYVHGRRRSPNSL